MKLICSIALMALSFVSLSQVMHPGVMVIFDKYEMRIVQRTEQKDTSFELHFRNEKYDYIQDLQYFRLSRYELKNLVAALTSISEEENKENDIIHISRDLMVVKQQGKPVIMGFDKESGFKQLSQEQAKEIKTAVYSKVKFSE